MLNSPEKPPLAVTNPPTVWRWGPLTVFTWSGLALLTIIAMQAGFGLARADTFPIWKDDYTIGAYPSFWLVYVCLPLAVRYVWVRKKLHQPIPSRFFWQCTALSVVCGFAFHWVYGWY